MITAIKERPILFSAPMVRAILEKRKTQTRRVADQKTVNECEGTFGAALDLLTRCPFGQPGDRLWVRETFAIETTMDWPGSLRSEHEYAKKHCEDGRPHKIVTHPEGGTYYRLPHYRATDPEPQLVCESKKCATCRDRDYGPHWKPSIHMPRWASRITLEITDVRVERLQEIDAVDAVAEGMEQFTETPPDFLFRELWDSIYKNWDANPFVWVVSFKMVKP